MATASIAVHIQSSGASSHKWLIALAMTLGAPAGSLIQELPYLELARRMLSKCPPAALLQFKVADRKSP